MGCGSSAARPAAEAPGTVTPLRPGGGRGGGGGMMIIGSGGGGRDDGGRGRGGLRAPAPWVMEGGPVSRSQLAMKRQMFWESRSEGRPTVWQNLKLAAEAMLEGNVDIAVTVLDASDVRVPGGDLAVVYDALGGRYELPRYTWSNPANIVSEAEMTKISHSSHRAHVGPVLELPVLARMSSSNTNLEQDVRLTVRSNQTVAQVKTALHDLLATGSEDRPADASMPKPNRWAGRGLPPARQRLVYRGRVLDDDVFMQEAGLEPGAILQVFVRYTA